MFERSVFDQGCFMFVQDTMRVRQGFVFTYCPETHQGRSAVPGSYPSEDGSPPANKQRPRRVSYWMVSDISPVYDRVIQKRA